MITGLLRPLSVENERGEDAGLYFHKWLFPGTIILLFNISVAKGPLVLSKDPIYFESTFIPGSPDIESPTFPIFTY